MIDVIDELTKTQMPINIVISERVNIFITIIKTCRLEMIKNDTNENPNLDDVIDYISYKFMNKPTKKMKREKITINPKTT